MKYRGLTRRHNSRGTCYIVRCWAQAGSASQRHSVGTYYDEREAARAYDLAALALEIKSPVLNLPGETYTTSELQAMKELLSRPRRGIKSSQFVGVRQKRVKWQATLALEGKVVSLGCFPTEQAAAVQHDLAQLVAHKLDGAACHDKLNFDWSDVPREQINNMSMNVRLRISQRLGTDIIEQQMQAQTQQNGDEQQQESDSCVQQAGEHTQQQRAQSSQDTLLQANQQAEQQVQQARLAVNKCKQRLQSKPQLSNEKRDKLKAAKKAAKAALKIAKQQLSLVKQQLAAADA